MPIVYTSIYYFDLTSKHRTKVIKSHAGKIHILNLKDLIEMKRTAGRPQDIEDVKALEQL